MSSPRLLSRWWSRWWRFTVERFDPASHLVMIAVFFLTNCALVGAVDGRVDLSSRWLVLLCLGIGTLAFFFKLRLYDEIKDYELDLIINPTRPLARGLLKHDNLYRGIAICIVLELVLFSVSGSAGLLAMSIAVAYSLLMYKEFFIREKIRPHLTTYAVTHTVVSVFLTIAIICGISGKMPWDLGKPYFLYALNSWCLFNVFEFGRKTFTSSEERQGVESYSKIFGRYGATALTLAMAAGSTGFLTAIPGPAQHSLFNTLLFSDLAFLAIGICYSFINRPKYGKIFRAISSFYIVWAYAAILWVNRGALAW